MFRIKKGRNSPRTLYNGPFVLPNQKSPVWVNKTSMTPGGGRPTSLYSHWSGQPVTLTQNGYTHAHNSPATSWPQPGLRPFLYRNEMGTPRSDEGCRPVFNLSFLDDSVVSTEIPTQQRGSLSIGSPCGFWPNTKGYFGHLQYPMTKVSPLARVDTKLTNANTSQLYSPLPVSNKVSTPRLNNFTSPRFSMLPFSHISPSSDTDVGNGSHNSKCCEYQHTHLLPSPRHQTEAWPLLSTGNTSQALNSCRQNEALQTFYLPPKPQLCSHTLAGLNSLPYINPPNQDNVYHQNPSALENIPTNLPTFGYQQKSTCNQLQQNGFTYYPNDHQNISYQNCLNNHDQHNSSQTANGINAQINQRVNYRISNKIEHHKTSDQDMGTGVSKYPILQTVPYNSNLSQLQRNYPPRGYVHDLQTIQEYLYQISDESANTKQSSFCSTYLSTEQSTNTINSKQNSLSKKSDCQQNNCACILPQQPDCVNQQKSTAMQKNGLNLEHYCSHLRHAEPENKEIRPKSRHKDEPRIQKNSNVDPHTTNEEVSIQNVNAFVNKERHCKRRGYASDSSNQHPGNRLNDAHSKHELEKSSWRKRETNQTRRNNNIYHSNKARGYTAKREHDHKNIPLTSDEGRDSGQTQRLSSSRSQANFRRENRRSPKFKEFKSSGNEHFLGIAPFSKNGRFVQPQEEERRISNAHWTQPRGRSRFYNQYRKQDAGVANAAGPSCSESNASGNSPFDRYGPNKNKDAKVGEKQDLAPRTYFEKNNAPRPTVLKKFAEELKKFHVKGNSAIQSLHDCANCSSLPVQIHCSIDPFYKDNKEDGFTAVLSVNGTCVARQAGPCRRLLKQKVYEEALSQLLQTTATQNKATLTNPVSVRTSTDFEDTGRVVGNDHDESDRNDIDNEKARGGNGGILTLPNHLKESRVRVRPREESATNGQFRQRSSDCESKKSGLDQIALCHLDHLIRELKSFRGSEGSKINQIWTVDKHCVKNRLKLIAIYKGSHQPNEHMTITCDLYLCERFLAQGKGSNRKFAQTYAYKRACDVLRNMNSAKDLLRLPRMDSKELKLPDVIDIVHKGYQVVEESNLCRMNRTKQPPLEHRNLNSLVILEHEDWSRDRKKHAHCILAQSATQCGCLLEWRSEPCGRGFRCTMTLQGEQIASCVTHLRKDAVRVASIVALFTFYETQPVVQGFHIDYPSIWITRNQLKEKAETTAAAHVSDAFNSSTADIAYRRLDQFPGLSKEDEYKLQLEDGVASAIEVLVEEYSKQKTLELIVCASDWRMEEKRCLRSAATGRSLRVVTENFQEEQILVISHKHSLIEIYNILQNQPGKAQGRYKILRDEEKPCYMDVAAEIAANESVLGEVATVQRPNFNKKFSANLGQTVNALPKTTINSQTFKERTLSLEQVVKVGDESNLQLFPLDTNGRSHSPSDNNVPAQKLVSETDNKQPNTVKNETGALETRQTQGHSKNLEEQNSPASSNISDVFVSANNTIDNGSDTRVRAVEIHDTSATSTLGGHCPDIDSSSSENKAQSPAEFSRPRITSTPSSHNAKGSNVIFKNSNESKITGSNVNAHRVLSFDACSSRTQDKFKQTDNAKVSESLAVDKDRKTKQQAFELQPSTLSPTPSDPSSARLNDPLSNSNDSHSSEAQSNDKSCQCGKSLEEQSHPITGPSEQFLHADQAHSSTNRSSLKRSRRQKMDGSIDLEACLGSPEQRAVCIIEHQSSRCIPFSSEFATCNETDFD